MIFLGLAIAGSVAVCLCLSWNGFRADYVPDLASDDIRNPNFKPVAQVLTEGK